MKKPEEKRFTIALPTTDHDRLKAIGAGAKPPLSLNYMVQLAITTYLKQVNESDKGTIEIAMSGAKS